MSKEKFCFITNTAFGKSYEDDAKTLKELDSVIEDCQKNGYKDIVICGGLYGLNRSSLLNKEEVEEKLDLVSMFLPRNLDINYKILSSYQEEFVLNRYGINLNALLEKRRSDVNHLGFDRAVLGDTLVFAKRDNLNKVGFNNGESFYVGDKFVNPARKLEGIIGDFEGNLVVIGGKNHFEEFVYNDRYVVALPSITSSSVKENNREDLGYILVERDKHSFEVKENVKKLSKTIKK